MVWTCFKKEHWLGSNSGHWGNT